MTSTVLENESPNSAIFTSWFALHWRVLLFATIGIGTSLALFIIVSTSPIPVGVVPATAVAMLAIITALAVGIERTLETFWSLVGQLANGWWPFNKIFTEVTALERDLKSQVTTFQNAIHRSLNNVDGLTDNVRMRLEQAQTEMTKLQERLAELEKLAPGNQRVSLIAATITQGMGMIDQIQPQIDYNLGLIDQSVAGLTDFAASFKENPARRLINIWAGAMIGMAIAYFIRLDVFYAVLGDVSSPWDWLPNLGVALTGLIVGLGSNPTHDVIAALQEVKKYRKSQNQPGPTTVETVSIGNEAMSSSAIAPSAFSSGQPSAPPVRRFR